MFIKDRQLGSRLHAQELIFSNTEYQSLLFKINFYLPKILLAPNLSIKNSKHLPKKLNICSERYFPAGRETSIFLFQLGRS